MSGSGLTGKGKNEQAKVKGFHAEVQGCPLGAASVDLYQTGQFFFLVNAEKKGAPRSESRLLTRPHPVVFPTIGVT